MELVIDLRMQSEQIDKLAAALAKAQGKMKPAVKNCTNPFFNSKFADLSSVWDSIREPFSENGLSLVQATLPIGDKLFLKTSILHSSGQWVAGFYPINSKDMSSQSIGSAMTYSRRYSGTGMSGVVSDEDDDGNAASGKNPNEHDQRPPGEYKQPVKPKPVITSKTQATNSHPANSTASKPSGVTKPPPVYREETVTAKDLIQDDKAVEAKKLANMAEMGQIKIPSGLLEGLLVSQAWGAGRSKTAKYVQELIGKTKAGGKLNEIQLALITYGQKMGIIDDEGGLIK